MCGIAGIVGKSDEALLTRMLDTLRHRGPDGQGTFSVPGHLSMGMTRLAIIDLITGDQPITNEDKSVQVILNGEIYNYKELRNDLVKCGHAFKTESDTEVIVHSYEKYGSDCVKYLNGMFAFALWDSKKKQLMLARDRLGIKPLFYAFHKNSILFASEINAILAVSEFKRDLNLNSVYNYFGSMVSIGEDTAFNNIYRFPSAHIAWIKDGQLHKEKYWSLSFKPKNKKSEVELCQEFRDLFDDATRIQLRSDVPVGVFLSGGIDSAAVAERAIQHLGKLKTFSLGFFDEDEGEVYNELKYAKKTADFLGTEHYEFKLEGESVRKHLKDTINSFGDLYCGSTAQYFVAELVSKHVKVALSGSGGDELFGSYDRPYRFEQSMGWKSFFLWRHFTNNGIRSEILNRYFLKKKGKLAQIFRRAVAPGEEYSNRAEAIFKKSKRESILSKDIVEHLNIDKRCETIYQHIFDELCSFPVEDIIMAIDMETQLKDEYLAYTDSFTMAHSLEARVPFLDHRLVEWAATLPIERKRNPGDPKYLLKRALYPNLPDELFHRPKMGFSLPYGKWLEGPLSPLVDEYLSTGYLANQNIFDVQNVHSIIKQFAAGKRGATTYQLWSLVIFQIWYQMYFNQGVSGAK
jgi:asparagine synthase (glutamine-hydrolysing)